MAGDLRTLLQLLRRLQGVGLPLAEVPLQRRAVPGRPVETQQEGGVHLRPVFFTGAGGEGGGGAQISLNWFGAWGGGRGGARNKALVRAHVGSLPPPSLPPSPHDFWFGAEAVVWWSSWVVWYVPSTRT